ncbi:MAG TPA: DHA2 family efflux MFS transporter permease subunit [Bryobacteraceae bacterium]|nr:DHA2 family efflux MFS transporter permease subunit [Bryobacteraceae bacterium]
MMFGTFMEVLDTTVVNVSLPHIAGSLSATVDEATWVLTSYLVANAVILPITGWLANYLGRKNLLMMSLTGFTVSSLLCGLAPNLPMLILFRLLQGACGGCMQPLSQAVLLEAFPPEDRGKAMGFWGLGIVAAPVLGPVLGGWLTDTLSWRWVFYINLPVGIASIIMTQRYIFDPSYIKRASSRIDYWGIGMLAVWVGTLQVALDKGQEEDWTSSAFINLLLVISSVSLIAFIWREIAAAHPVVSLSVFKTRTYAVGVFLMTLLGFGLYGSLVILPIWLQTLLGYPSIQAGLALAPRGMGSMLAMPVVGAISGRIDNRKLLACGLTLCGTTMWMLSRLNLNVGYWDLFWPQFLQGISLGLIFVPLTTVTMAPVARENMGNATSLFNLMRNLGGSMGIAATTALTARYQQEHQNYVISHISPYNPKFNAMLSGLRTMFMGHGDGYALANRKALASVYGVVQQQTAMLTFVDVFRLLMMVFVVMLPLLLLLKKPPTGGPRIAAH